MTSHHDAAKAARRAGNAIRARYPNTGLRYAWDRPEKPFPLKGVAAYNNIAEYFKTVLNVVALQDI